MLKRCSLLCLILVCGGVSAAGQGSVCLGRNLSVVLSEHSERLHIKVGDSPPIYFYKPQPPPRIVVRGLDTNQRHLVEIYFDGKVVQSWQLDFKEMESNMVNLWRAKGAWKMVPSLSERCAWPPE